jgi:hypothetical protein
MLRQLNEWGRGWWRSREYRLMRRQFLLNWILLASLDFEICLERSIRTESRRIRHRALGSVIDRSFVTTCAVFYLDHHVVCHPLLRSSRLTLRRKHHLLLVCTIPISYLIFANYYLLLCLIILLSLVKELGP